MLDFVGKRPDESKASNAEPVLSRLDFIIEKVVNRRDRPTDPMHPLFHRPYRPESVAIEESVTEERTET